MKIAAGFITYGVDSAKYLPYFLDSLFAALEPFGKENVLVMAQDNSEEPDNLNREYISEVFNKDEELVEFRWSGENIGFGRAYNKMIRRALEFGADYFLVINPDTVLAPDAITKLAGALEEDGSLGSAAPKIRRWNFEKKELTGAIDSCGLVLKPGLRFVDLGQGQPDRGQFDQAGIIGPSGAAGLFRLSDLEKVSPDGQYFDERFFMYKEDCDLAYRLFLAGSKSILVPDSMIHHDRTAAADGEGFKAALKARTGKSRAVKSWSLLNQHWLFIKYWDKQDLSGKLRISAYMIAMFFFVLFKEPYLLKNYSNISKYIFKKL